MPLPTTPQKPTSVQPGGGTCMAIELCWARFRKFWLRKLCPSYVQAMQAKRQGECPNCPHDIIDARDLKYTRNVCGYSFKPEDDEYAYRNVVPFARHGFAEMFLFTIAFLILFNLSIWAAVEIHWLFIILWPPLFLLELEILFFFRDPERSIPPEADAVVSPADGTVTHVEEVDEPDFPGGRALRISIFLSIFNVHVNRLPRSGKVAGVRYFPGEYLDARNPASAVRNEQLWIDLVEDNGRPLRVKQISGAIARRIVCWLKEGEAVTKGERLGMIKLGSRTDLLLPAGQVTAVRVKPGDKIKGG